MKMLYGVMDEADTDTVWTYEAESYEEAAELYLDNDPENNGVVVRVFVLGRHARAFVQTTNGVVEVSNPAPVRKS